MVSSGMCWPLSQGCEGSARVRPAEISRDRWGVRVVEQGHPLGQLIETPAGAMRPRHLPGHGHLATADHAEW